MLRAFGLRCHCAVRTDGVDDAAVSVLRVIQTAQVSDGLSRNLVLPEHEKEREHNQLALFIQTEEEM